LSHTSIIQHPCFTQPHLTLSILGLQLSANNMGAPDPTTYAAQPIEAPPQLMESNKRKRKSTRTTVTEGSPDDEVIFLGKNAKGTAMSKNLSDEYELGEGNPQKVKKTKKSLRNTDEEKRLRKSVSQ
jgi:hypothetical protein